MSDMSWPGAAAHADKRPFLLARAKILAAIRAWFAAEGFVEADVGALVESPGAEIHVEAYAVEGGGYLHISPEFALKRLVAAGETKLYRLGPVYRRSERGPLHAPEFTLLEWYRAGAPYEAVMDDALEIVRVAANAIDAKTLRWRDVEADPAAPAERLGVEAAFRRHAGVEVLAPGFAPRATETWSDAFSRVLVEKVEPKLGLGAPTLLTEYPAREAALARLKPGDPRIAERFELYACGVELANGYGELTDPVEQRARFEAAMDEKARRYGKRWPAPERFLDDLAHMPPSSGCALGVDRLIMLCAHARRIDDVLWTTSP